MSARWKAKFNQARRLQPSLRAFRRAIAHGGQRGPRIDALLNQLSDFQTSLARLLNSELPDSENLVLPTRLGNVIRCFERYPSVAYGMDAIVIWPRLVAKIDPSFAATVDDAKSTFDFMINCSLLCGVSAAGALAAWLIPTEVHPSLGPLAWTWRVTLFVALSVLFYVGAIGAASRWGDQVRAAFDLYRIALLGTLGYEQRPADPEEERTLWQSISSRLLFPDSVEERIPYKPPDVYVVPVPSDLLLKVSRRIEPTAHGTLLVSLVIPHDDAAGGAASSLKVIETIPDDWRLIVDSVRGWIDIDSGSGRRSVAVPVRTSDLKPLKFNITFATPLRLTESCTIEYLLRAAKA